MLGGGPQGTLLALFLFLVLINSSGYPKSEKITGKMLTDPLKLKKACDTIQLKYIDDASFGEAINLKNVLKKVPDSDIVRPVNFHQRTHHTLPGHLSKVQWVLNKLESDSSLKRNENQYKEMQCYAF